MRTRLPSGDLRTLKIEKEIAIRKKSKKRMEGIEKDKQARKHVSGKLWKTGIGQSEEEIKKRVEEAGLADKVNQTVINRMLYKKSLHEFTKQFWGYAESKEYINGWHIEVLQEHLEEVSKGNILRLIINMPPRHMKSLGISVFWMCWDWLSHPERQFLFSSYAHNLSIRDNVKAKRIVSSNEYLSCVRTFHPKFDFTEDVNNRIKFDNTCGGYRMATSVGGMLTGEGGDIIVIDDPHNVKDIENKSAREVVHNWWNDSMSNRLNIKDGAFVIVMHRLHQGDLCGHVLKEDDEGWVTLCLPARYEGKTWVSPTLGVKDPRMTKGEPL